MKRIVLIAGLALTIFSCAQHDSESPDTSGNDPQQPNQSTNMNTTPTTGDSTNMNNDGTNNNQQVNTGDSSLNRQNQ